MLSAPSLGRELTFVGLIGILLLNSKLYKRTFQLVIGYTLLIGLDLMLIPHLSGFLKMLSLTCIRVLRLYVPIVITCGYLVSSTTVSSFIAAFQKMKVHDAIIIPFTVLFRFLPTILEKWKSIQYAMRFRGLKVSLTTMLLKPLTTMEYVLVPLLMSSTKTANELTAAALSRGLKAGHPRSTYQNVKFGLVDVVLTSFVLGMIITSFVK